MPKYSLMQVLEITSTVSKREHCFSGHSLLHSDLLEITIMFTGNTDLETFVITTDSAYDALVKLIKEDGDNYHD